MRLWQQQSAESIVVSGPQQLQGAFLVEGKTISGEHNNGELARLRDPGSVRPLTGIERLAAEAEALRNSPDGWREEVVSRVQNYRTRRRRYNPELSLHLDFEEQRRANRSMIVGATASYVTLPESPAPATEIDDTGGVTILESTAMPAIFLDEAPARISRPRKIIEFPRPAMPMHPLSYELAEPVVDGPRILEVAAGEQFELLPAVPAIMLDEADADAQPCLSAESAAAVPVAPLARRFWCGVIDAVAIAAAVAAFAATFLKIATAAPSLRSRAAWMAAAVVLAGFWMAYQYCFLVYGRATLGMRLARLETLTFDGEALTVAGRRLRALGMVVSFIAAGLGFFWALLDEDGLCWHDRISRSYLSVR